MLSEKEARNVVAEAWRLRFPGVEPRLGSLQIVQAQGRFESSYGSGWNGHPDVHNWGAVIAGKNPVDGECPEGSFAYRNVSAQGSFVTCFKWYPSHVDGCADMLRIMSKTPEEKEALLEADVFKVCLATYRARYYSMNLPPGTSKEKAEEINVTHRMKLFEKTIPLIAHSLKEPVDVVGMKGGKEPYGGSGPPPGEKPPHSGENPPSSGETASGSGGLVALGAAGILAKLLFFR